jgi:hypothetical protein
VQLQEPSAAGPPIQGRLLAVGAVPLDALGGRGAGAAASERVRVRVPLLDAYTGERLGVAHLAVQGGAALLRLAAARDAPLDALRAAVARERAAAERARAAGARRAVECERARAKAHAQAAAIDGARAAKAALQAKLVALTTPSRAAAGGADGGERRLGALRLTLATLRREHADEVEAISALLERERALQ